MKFIWNYIRREEWSPYVAGVLLGLVCITAVWASNNLLGASGAFENLAGMIGKAFDPAAFDDMYFDLIMPPGITWGVLLLVGVFFGGMIGAATSGTLLWGKKGAANSDAQWKRIFGPQVWKRWVLAFIGAIILEYGAGIAGAGRDRTRLPAAGSTGDDAVGRRGAAHQDRRAPGVVRR